MLFNGDIYSFSGLGLDADDVNQRSIPFSDNASVQNDGLTLFNLLDQCQSEIDMCNVIANLQGPFAFILLNTEQNRVWFTRDFFGRESLLFSFGDADDGSNVHNWHLSSVSIFSNVFEIPTSGLFCLELETKQLNVYPYSHFRESISNLQADFFVMLKASGFINSATICATTKIELQFATSMKFPETQEEISRDSILSDLVHEASCTDSGEEFISRSVKHLSFFVDSFIECLTKSVKRRIFTLPPFCKNCIGISPSEIHSKCSHSKVGVLFSGGLDSTVIAYLAAELLPSGSSLDLINVAFSKNDDFSSVPDRETALASYKMLNDRFKTQGKVINLVLVNVGKAEVEEQRRKRIRYLISPLKSVLDDSLGVCLWFAARGIGVLYDNDVMSTENSYVSPIRVVLLGSGADECLGGYGRHRSAYEKLGWRGLKSEMQLDFDRISVRNMGRDNRIVSDHGICPRIPFLDEHVVDFLTSQCHLWVKCCPVNVGPLGSRGSGEKLLLRAVAAKLFGDQHLSLALFPKRAMQFGSKIAKLENSKEKGGDSCGRLRCNEK